MSKFRSNPDLYTFENTCQKQNVEVFPKVAYQLSYIIREHSSSIKEKAQREVTKTLVLAVRNLFSNSF